MLFRSHHLVISNITSSAPQLNKSKNIIFHFKFVKFELSFLTKIPLLAKKSRTFKHLETNSSHNSWLILKALQCIMFYTSIHDSHHEKIRQPLNNQIKYMQNQKADIQAKTNLDTISPLSQLLVNMHKPFALPSSTSW